MEVVAFFSIADCLLLAALGATLTLAGSSIIIMIITSCAISTAIDYGSCCFDVFVLQCFVLL